MKYIFKIILSMFFLNSLLVLATDPNEYVGGVDGYGGSAFDPGYIGNGIHIQTVRDQLANPVPSMGSSNVTTVQGYTIVTHYQTTNNNSNSQLYDMSKESDRRAVMRKLLAAIYNIPESQVTNQMIDNNVEYFPQGNSYDPNTGQTIGSFGVTLGNNGLFTYFGFPLDKFINPSVSETVVTTTVTQFETIIRSYEDPIFHIQNGNVIVTNGDIDTGIVIPPQFVHLNGGSITLSYEQPDDHEDDDTNPASGSSLVYEYYYAIPRKPANIEIGGESPTFMSALNSYNSLNPVSLGSASFIIRCYIDLVIPSFSNGRAAYIRNLIERIANYYHVDEGFAELALIEYMKKGQSVIMNNNDDENIIYQIENENPCAAQVIKDANNLDTFISNKIRADFGLQGEGQPNINLIYKTENLPMEVSGATKIVFNDDGSYHIEISYDYSMLQGGTDLAIATTTFHENFHAHLYYALEENPEYMAQMSDEEINTINSGDYATLINSYAQYKLEKIHGDEIDNFNINQLKFAHHEILSTFISEIAQAIKTYAIGRGYDLANDEYYNDLAWSGLGGTLAYFFLSEEKKQNIEKAYLAENYGIYLPKGNSPCN